MTFNAASQTAIACDSPTDAIRLAAQLGKATSWASIRPDLVTATGAMVDAVWYSAPAVPAAAAAAAVTAAKAAAGLGPGSRVSLSHHNTASGGLTTTQQI